MKRIIALALVLVLAAFSFTACSGSKYTLSIAVESTVEDGKITNYVAVLVLDKNEKIVAARIDCAEATATIEADAIKDVATIATKVDKGDAYGMKSGSFAKQTKAFEDHIVGMTAEEVANLDMALVSGCTMPNSPASFKAVIAKAFTTSNKVTFKGSEDMTVGAAISMSIKDSKATADFAGVVISGGKVAAAILDSNEQTLSITDGAITAGKYEGTKADKGDNYKMDAGNWLSQAAVFASSAVGKTVDELNDLEAVSDALKEAGCTMQFTTYGYKATIIKAAGLAR